MKTEIAFKAKTVKIPALVAVGGLNISKRNMPTEWAVFFLAINFISRREKGEVSHVNTPNSSKPALVAMDQEWAGRDNKYYLLK